MSDKEYSPRPWHIAPIEQSVIQQTTRGVLHAIYDAQHRVVAIPVSGMKDSDLIVDAINKRCEEILAFPLLSSNVFLRAQRNELRQLCVVLLSCIEHSYASTEEEVKIIDKAKEVLERIQG